ncbi:MAG: XkdX family protein [Ruminococcaceae bacterium]|nr:XkdX family protein [Oscillospiraceae bacterium]
MAHSAQYEHLKARYEQGRISDSMLRKYVAVGRITAAEYTEITGKDY